MNPYELKLLKEIIDCEKDLRAKIGKARRMINPTMENQALFGLLEHKVEDLDKWMFCLNLEMSCIS